MNRERAVIFLICVSLIISTLCVYWQTTGHGFINLDDPYYIVDNRHVNNGFSLEGLAWAFKFSKEGDQSYWHPLTWISHMLDTHLFGLDAGKHHLVSALYHSSNAVLLFLVLVLMTRAVWKSAFVAALFALHPVNVESVAWIAERKNLISTMFWLLTLIAYFYYAKKPDILKYLAVIAAFALGLLCKPMLVTIPFVLLLLDYWPLNRVQFHEEKNGIRAFLNRANMWLVYEKLPLLFISSGFMVVTSFSLAAAKQNLTSQVVPLSLKVENAITSYVAYIGKLLWPQDLSIFYMFPSSIPLWKVIASLGLLGGITCLVFLTYRSKPYLLVGWLWFLGTLLPVIGIVQGGIWPAMAERWVYIPSIGLYMAAVWTISGLTPLSRRKTMVLACAAAAVLIALSVRSWLQLGYWKSDLALYSHSLEIDPNNYFAHYGLGIFYQDQGDHGTALHHYNQALRVTPGSPAILFCIGNIHALEGNMQKAVANYEKSLRIFPWNPDLRVNYGNALTQLGRMDEAIIQYTEALRMIPYHAQAYNNLGVVYRKNGELKKAQECFRKALEINPGFSDASRNYIDTVSALSNIEQTAGKIVDALRADPGNVSLLMKLARLRLKAGDLHGAVSAYRESMVLRPDSLEIMYELVLAYTRNGEYGQALDLLQKMQESRPENPEIPYNIACIYARQGKPDEAVLWLRQAVEKGLNDIDLIRGDPDLKIIRNTPFYQGLIMGTETSGSLTGGQ